MIRIRNILPRSCVGCKFRSTKLVGCGGTYWCNKFQMKITLADPMCETRLDDEIGMSNSEMCENIRELNGFNLEYDRKLQIPIGLAGSGKTTNRPPGYFVVCKDDIRAMLLNSKSSGVDYLEEIEDIVDTVAKDLFNLLLRKGANIYLDGCNLKKKYRSYFEDLAHKYGYKVEHKCYYNFQDVTIQNRRREKVVPLWRIRQMQEEIEFPEGFEQRS